MRDYPVRKARKMAGPFWVHRKGVWERVQSISKWGKNWQLVVGPEDQQREIVVGDDYLLTHFKKGEQP